VATLQSGLSRFPFVLSEPSFYIMQHHRGMYAASHACNLFLFNHKPPSHDHNRATMPEEQNTTPFLPTPITSQYTRPTLNVEIPLILLGRTGVNTDWDYGPTRDDDRLNIVRDALWKLCSEVPVRVWHAQGFEEKSDETGTTESERRRAWKEEEGKRWIEMERSGCWVLAVTGTERSSRVGARKEGIGCLTAAEHAHIDPEKIWVLSFSLGRFGIPAARMDVLNQELCRIAKVLEDISAFSYGEDGVMFSVVCGEQCWSRIGIRTTRIEDGTEDEFLLEKRTVRNLMRVWMESERGILGLGTAGWVNKFWPVSHAVVWGRVRKMREIMVLRKSGRMLEGDNEDDETNGVGKSWAEQLCKEGEVERLVDDMTISNDGVVIDIQLKDDTAKTPADVLHVDDELSNGRSAPALPAISRISTLEIAVPRLNTTLDSLRLLAYIQLIAKFFLFADMYSEKDMLVVLRQMREDSEFTLDERPVDTLVRVAQSVGIEGRYVNALQEMVVGHEGGGRSEARNGPFEDLLGHIERAFKAEKAYMATFLERYEFAGGFVVSEAGERTRRRASQ
jgi:hypothetical protein